MRVFIIGLMLGVFSVTMLFAEEPAAEKDAKQEKKEEKAAKKAEPQEFTIGPSQEELQKEQFNGYSYLIFAMENVTYEEMDITDPFLGKVNSKAEGTSPTYMSGSLIKLTDRYDISMDFSSTLTANTIEEEWRSDGSLYLKNKFDLLSNVMMFLGHYKYTPKHRLVFGGAYLLNSFKRFEYRVSGSFLENKIPELKEEGKLPEEAEVSASDLIPSQLAEERSTTVIGVVGYWYESNPIGLLKNWRYAGNVLLGIPLWQKLTNTTVEQEVFDDKDGFNLDMSGRFGYSLTKSVELGGYVGYSYMVREGGEKRRRETVTIDGQEFTGTRILIWPRNITQFMRFGFAVHWHFD